ncbi:nitrilase [Cellulomonas sp. WB94]|uniref:pyridoxamine 5'-phosphate oxidase family protein n=1 Tax=Cellulomonas sp. WB94 TaxID=2173174 RepID=UPI000D569728|nr:TIGR03618 family F420-dependent PPOX class oxidoreductase [Cellulomonas sp. WB94]PVU81604.1 nitrilase [Cellulomonas sp. WB94]
MLALTANQLDFVAARHLATLTTLRADGSPHVVPVAFTWDAVAGRARVTTRITSVKARNVERAATGGAIARAALCQFDGQRWLTLEGSVTLSRDPADVAEAVEAYAVRYRRLEFKAERIVLHLVVDRVMGTVR